MEGYAGNVAGGLVVGKNAARAQLGIPMQIPPRETMTGALFHYVVHADSDRFQPMKANFGLLPGLVPPVRKKLDRYRAYADRAQRSLERFVEATEWNAP
jgi:methylenetetrahydrofolate--tRNA-(uracil-5-)-methyltransferase